MKKSLLLIALAAGCLTSATAAIPDGGWSVTPEEGSTVTSITVITVSKTNEYYMDPYLNRSVKINGEAIRVTQKATNGGGTMEMTLATPIEKSGTYEIALPSGMFTYGFSFYDDGSDSPEMSWTVTVDNPDHPIEPDIPDVTITGDPATESTIKSLSSVTLTFDGAATVTAAETAAPTITSLGQPVDAAVTFTAATAANQIVMNITPAITASGEYTLTAPEGTFELTSDGGTKFNSPEFKLNYTVKAPPAVGDKFVVDKIRYIVLSRDPMTAAVTWPADEADYADLTTIPTSTTYEGETFAVTEIGDLALSMVIGIGEFTVPDGITRIGEGAFWESSLSSINIPASVVSIGNEAFEDCKSLTTFTLPSTVRTIGEDLLFGCASLKVVTLPDNLTAIPNGFLQGCALLERVDVPASVTRIGEFAMSECAALATTNIPDGVTELGRFAYAYCSALKSLTIPESVTTMGHGVFYSAGITEATLPENLTIIPDGTFQCCTDLKEFTIGPNVTEIEKEAFYWAFGLEKITFGAKVATIGDKAFFGDEAITEVICLNPVPATGAEFTQTVYDNAALTVPEGAAEAYRAAPGWKEFKDINGSAHADAPITGDSVQTSLDGDVLHITADTTVTISNMQGAVLYTGGTGTVTLPARGIYLLSTPAGTVKIIR